jgi:hypothetical protein
MAPAGSKHVSEDHQDMRSFVNLKFLFKEPGWMNSGYISSETLIARVAKVIGRVISKDGLFDIRGLGLTHALLLLFGISLIISSAHNLRAPARRALTPLIIIIFTDLGYVAFFNTFYSQTASLIFGIIGIGFFSLALNQPKERIWAFTGFAAAAILFITSKPQEAPQALFLAAILFLAARILKIRFASALGAGAAIVTLLISGWYYINAPAGVRDACFYNAVFDIVSCLRISGVADVTRGSFACPPSPQGLG